MSGFLKGSSDKYADSLCFPSAVITDVDTPDYLSSPTRDRRAVIEVVPEPPIERTRGSMYQHEREFPSTKLHLRRCL